MSVISRYIGSAACAALLLVACAATTDEAPAPVSDAAVSDAADGSTSTADTPPTGEDVAAEVAEPWPGTTATSCGAEDQGLVPVDCTAFGDVNAGCVFSNHCACSANDGFKCEGAADGTGSECGPGVVCVPHTAAVSEGEVGSVPTSCGAPGQGVVPIDCTKYGDVNATCVFSNHCMCSVDDGFVCETPSDLSGDLECDPGVYCVPSDG